MELTISEMVCEVPPPDPEGRRTIEDAEGAFKDVQKRG